jgi:hypothetical protein
MRMRRVQRLDASSILSLPFCSMSRSTVQPAVTVLDPSIPHAPVRTPNLTPAEFKLAVRNALRYFPAETHKVLAPEFAAELRNEGHIYMRRFAPTEYVMQACQSIHMEHHART